MPPKAPLPGYQRNIVRKYKLKIKTFLSVKLPKYLETWGVDQLHNKNLRFE